ncbi:RNA methyltransferase [Brevibacterium daeguense]|uniref:RNA methyltransferase n=1 Tax=Brevibacterium daeguense TaxID=909936 RepID=A0ABP8EMA7_9MICO|nr:RNA methyltransferase [Brevibacterium daeguense]
MSEITQHERLTGPVIHSPQSKRVREAAKLVRRSWRTKTRQFLAEGPQAVREALSARAEAVSGAGADDRVDASPIRLVDLFATAAAADRHPDILELAERAGTPVRQIDPALLAQIADTEASQGLLAVCEFLDVDLSSAISSGSRLVVVLSQVRDPGNAGTVLRVADAAGADAVVYTGSSVDVYNPRTVRATAGSLFHLPVVTGADLAEVTERGRASGMQVLAADAHPPVHDLHSPWATGLDLTRPTMWVFGNEAWGLPEADRQLCDAAVAIPIYGRAESLNLATAAGICIYETARNVRL